MKYQFSQYLQMDYQELSDLLSPNETITKAELLELGSGRLTLELLQAVKGIEFQYIQKDAKNDIYIW